MQEMITSLTFNVFVKICLQCLNVNYEVVYALKLILLDLLVLARENETTIFWVLNEINQVLCELFLVLLLYFVRSFVFMIFLLRRWRIAKILLSSTNLWVLRQELIFIDFEEVFCTSNLIFSFFEVLFVVEI